MKWLLTGCARYFGGYSKKLLLPTIAPFMSTPYLGIPISLMAARWYWEPYYLPFRFTAIFPDIPILLWVLPVFSGSTCSRTSTFHFLPKTSATFGAAGIYR